MNSLACNDASVRRLEIIRRWQQVSSLFFSWYHSPTIHSWHRHCRIPPSSLIFDGARREIMIGPLLPLVARLAPGTCYMEARRIIDVYARRHAWSLCLPRPFHPTYVRAYCEGGSRACRSGFATGGPLPCSLLRKHARRWRNSTSSRLVIISAQ